MSSYNKGKSVVIRLLGVSLLLGLLTLTGCMCDPDDGNIPTSPMDERDGIMPLPSQMRNRYN